MLMVLSPLLNYKPTSKKTKTTTQEGKPQGKHQVPRSTLPNEKWTLLFPSLAILPSQVFLFANCTLPNCQVHMAQFSSEHCQGHIAKLAHCYLTLWIFCQIANCDLPCGLPEWTSSCPWIFNFLGCQRVEFFSVCPNSFPRLPPFSFFFFPQPA